MIESTEDLPRSVAMVTKSIISAPAKLVFANSTHAQLPLELCHRLDPSEEGAIALNLVPVLVQDPQNGQERWGRQLASWLTSEPVGCNGW